MKLFVFLIGTAVLLEKAATHALVEKERIAEYKKRNYTWPLLTDDIVPNTTGWTKRMKRRFAQVGRIHNHDDRYNGWMSVMAAAIVMPTFSESGWGLTRAPPEVIAELKESLERGLADNNAREERGVTLIEGGEKPLFISQPKLNRKVLQALKPMHEEWSGVKLQGSLAYGLRVYRNNSLLHMHVDNLRTHVISCILHVDHSEDSEPWPLLIEDFQGNTNEVFLESGDLLFYESSKCIHGRPKPFNGSWYSSLFVHYRPDDWDSEQAVMETHYSIPEHWATAEPMDPDVDELTMVGTTMKEPGCPYGWCGTNDTVKWRGPGIEGTVISTGFEYDAFSSSTSEDAEL